LLNKEKTRVAVLYGGRSAEHEVSLVSATNVIMNVDRALFDVIPIGIDREGSWFLGDDVFKQELTSQEPMLRLHRDQDRMLFNPELIGKSSPMMIPPTSLLTRNNRLFDVIFPVIHGPLCEDGTVQGLLELADVPYVGCNVLASAIGMDKDVSKRLVQHAGIHVPHFLVIRAGEWQQNNAQSMAKIAAEFTYPIFVKPVNTGSSVGVSKVNKPEDLQNAIHLAFQYDTRIIIEQGIDAIEIEVAVLESLDDANNPFASVPGEIRPSATHGFYSYASKYLDENGAELIIPAPISDEVKEKVMETAKQIFTILNCEGMARVDFLLDRHTHCIYFNEVNSLPGFTQISMYPKLMAASGKQYTQLLTHLIELAVKRHDKKTQLIRHFMKENS